MVNKILIAGGGQLGSRYLQGLSKFRTNLDIYVYDISNDSLDLSRARWLETNPSLKHKVKYIKNLNLLPKNIDLAIISTTADVRSSVISKIKSKSKIM